MRERVGSLLETVENQSTAAKVPKNKKQWGNHIGTKTPRIPWPKRAREEMSPSGNSTRSRLGDE